MIRNQTLRRLLDASIYIIFGMMFITLFTLGPRIEAVINPVVGAFKIDKIWSEIHNGKRYYYIQGAMLKLRGECELTEVIMYAAGGFVDKNAKVIAIDFSPDPAHMDGNLSSRPIGAQYWGPWRLHEPTSPVGPIISISVRHRCHALWNQTQVIFTGLTKDFFLDMEIDLSQ